MWMYYFYLHIWKKDNTPISKFWICSCRENGRWSVDAQLVFCEPVFCPTTYDDPFGVWSHQNSFTVGSNFIGKNLYWKEFTWLHLFYDFEIRLQRKIEIGLELGSNFTFSNFSKCFLKIRWFIHYSFQKILYRKFIIIIFLKFAKNS